MLLLPAAVAQSPVDSYNVVWDSPSKDSSGSMPLGNGDVGINVWVEESGDLVFYIGKTDAWSETARLLKVGRVRVRLSPNPFGAGRPFRQTLNLSTGEVVITSGDTTLTVWVDAYNPVVRVDVDSKTPVGLQAFYERWRDQQRVLEGKEAQSAYGLDGGPEPIVSDPDSIVLEGTDRVTWYHRNARSAYTGIMKHQGLESVLAYVPDPLLNRTFGATIEGDGLTRMNPSALRSKEPLAKRGLSVVVLTEIAASAEEWIDRVHALAVRLNTVKLADRKAMHTKWWDGFWKRSWLRINGGAEQEAVSRGYALQRYLTACAGRGAYPIKFNGSIFTVDTPIGDERFDADYRRWGGPYWFQNTRLIYWPLLASGDFEFLQPFFRMYVDGLVLATRRTRLYFDHDGAFFPETMYFWGAYANSNYGWKRDGKPAGWVENTYIRHHFNGMLELVAIMLDYYAYTQDKQFARTTLAPVADEVIRFYDGHYKRDGQTLVLAPAQSLETFPDVVNPLPDVAGLKWVLTGLLQAKVPLDKNVANRARLMLQQLPAIPTREIGGKKVITAAEKINAPSQNSENPELYAIFPFRLYGVNKLDYDLGRSTFEARTYKRTGGWQQDAIQAAFIGDAQTAQTFTADNFLKKHEGSRFPGFFGPNFDWVPDQDHGNVASIALQSMLMQCEGDKIMLFPAWPKHWDVEFKLHAPRNTTVEGVFRKGKLEGLRVNPTGRVADIINLAGN